MHGAHLTKKLGTRNTLPLGHSEQGKV